MVACLAMLGAVSASAMLACIGVASAGIAIFLRRRKRPTRS